MPESPYYLTKQKRNDDALKVCNWFRKGDSREIDNEIISLKVRRRILLTFSCAGCTLSTGAIAVWFYLNDFISVSLDNYSDIIFLSIAMYYAVYNIGLGPVGTSINGELFVPKVKPLSSSITTIIAAFVEF